jgi:hypothetical protein
MPTSATHITILQRLAAQHGLSDLLGDPAADPQSPENLRARYANLGAVGPDVFYAMLDYKGGAAQELEDLLVKIAGTFDLISSVSTRVNLWLKKGLNEAVPGLVSDVEEIQKLTGLISAVIMEGELSAVIKLGFNPWSQYEPLRQRDKPRKEWFWADYLHYVRSGQFARQLLERSAGNANLQAYALGYLTHYVTDVVGHPYVNQVVGAPWRLYWQRHHLVENFIDAYVWPHWHDPQPQPPNTAEPPLDVLRAGPNPDLSTGGPLSYSRLHDHILIGDPTLGDPVDAVVEAVTKAIEEGLTAIRVPPLPAPLVSDPDFDAWAQMLVDALEATYPRPYEHPENLPNGGYPTADDVKAAYSAFRMILKVSTEETVKPPTAPDIPGLLRSDIEQILNDIQRNLSSLPSPPPSTSGGGGLSLDALWEEIKADVSYVAAVVEVIVNTVVTFVKDALKTANDLLTAPVKFALSLIDAALYSLYRSFRDTLVCAAYAVPFTDELDMSIGSLSATTLWQSPGNPPVTSYPAEEELEEQKLWGSSYMPFAPPTLAPEQPGIEFVAPYASGLPDQFIDGGGQELFADMFSADGPRKSQGIGGFVDGPLDFGNAMLNCIKALGTFRAGGVAALMLPDYNLDGDRGYAWPCWDLEYPGVEKLAPENRTGPVHAVVLP